MTTDQWIAIAGVGASTLGPIVVVVLAILADRRLKGLEQKIERKQKISETRFDLYREIGFKMNDLYSYFQFVGNWKDHTPADIIQRKRDLDRHIFTYRPIFSEVFTKRYDAFIAGMFKLYGGWGKDARLRTTSKNRKEDGDDQWAACFTQEDNKKAIKESYELLMTALAADLGLSAETD